MPYKDPERKKEWERLHRPQRLARRRELRRNEAAQQASQPETPRVEDGRVNFLFPLIAGGVLAAYAPKFAIGAGGLTLAIAAAYKKDWSWWILGVVTVALGVLFYWIEQSAQKQSQMSRKAQNKNAFCGSGA